MYKTKWGRALVVFVLAVLAPGGLANAQAPVPAEPETNRNWNLSIRAGGGIPVYRGTEVDEPKAYFGPVGGVGVWRRLGKRWGIQADLMLNRRLAGANYIETSYGDTTVNVVFGTLVIPIRDSSYRSDVVNDARITFTYLDLPLTARFDLVQRPGYSLYLMAGAVAHWVAQSELTGTTTVFISEFDTFGDITLVGTEEPIDPNTLRFADADFGLVFGGGSRFQFGRSAFCFEMRFTLGLPDVETTSQVEMRTGHFGMLLGYEFGW